MLYRLLPFIVMTFCLLIPLFFSLVFAQYVCAKKLFEPLRGLLDYDLFDEAKQKTFDTHEARAGLVHTFIILLISGGVLYFVGEEWIPELGPRLFLTGMLSLAVSGSWYAFQLHTIVKVFSENLTLAVKWNTFSRMTGEVMDLKNDTFGVTITLETISSDPFRCFVPRGTEDEATRNLSIGNKVSVYQFGGKVKHIVLLN